MSSNMLLIHLASILVQLTRACPTPPRTRGQAYLSASFLSGVVRRESPPPTGIPGHSFHTGFTRGWPRSQLGGRRAASIAQNLATSSARPDAASLRPQRSPLFQTRPRVAEVAPASLPLFAPCRRIGWKHSPPRRRRRRLARNSRQTDPSSEPPHDWLLRRR